MMYFLRVAKTGSSGFMHLLGQLGQKLDYEVTRVQTPFQFERLKDSPAGVSEEMFKLISTHANMVYCKHYSFFNFGEHGHPWVPDWFSLVRDPIEKVNQILLMTK